MANRWVLIIAGILLIEVQGFLIGFEHKALLIFFILMVAYYFKVKGGILAAIAGWSIYAFHTANFYPLSLAGYIFVGICAGLFVVYQQKIIVKQSLWHDISMRNAKQLNVFREVSVAIQEAHELDKILKIIATAITAGHGLGFNRSIILLTSKDQLSAYGAIGVGPMNPDEGYKIWENTLNNKYNLTELIKIHDEETSLDSQFNEQVKMLHINLDQQCIISKALEIEEPLHIRRNNGDDATKKLLADVFHMNEFVVYPLINRGSKVGVLIIDNIVNKQAITHEDIDSVIPIASQAAIAIQQAQLYEQIEDMAMKDGLTGLMNHRSFEQKIDKLLIGDTNRKLACIMIDIDFFKHYNDTNGHLQGNHVLKQMASVIRESIRLQDDAFRFGGEEFVILLPNTAIDEAVKIAEQLRENVEHTNFPYRELQPNGRLTISLGVASTEQLSKQTTNHLIDAADHALYQAKHIGRNKVWIFEELKSYG